MINCKEEDREVNLQIVKKALERGVNFIDTAEICEESRTTSLAATATATHRNNPLPPQI